MIVILNLIILFLSSVILFSTKTIIKQKKLIVSYDKCSKLQGKMQRLIHLANLAKTCGHDMVINYSTIHNFYNVFFYVKGKVDYEPCVRQITDDESFEAATKELEWLIK